MDINKLISSINENLPEFMASYCIVNGAIMNLEEIQNMGCREFGLRAKERIKNAYSWQFIGNEYKKVLQ